MPVTTCDIETIVVPPGTAHTEPADSLIATLFGGGEQSLSLVDSGGSALWVSSSLASGLELAAPHEPGEPMRGSLGRGGAAVMKGILKTSTPPSQPPIVSGTELEPHLAGTKVFDSWNLLHAGSLCSHPLSYH